MANLDVKQNIIASLGAFTSGSLSANALNLFSTLGYNTDRQAPLDKPNYANFKETFFIAQSKFNEEKALVKDWLYVDLLFQLSKEEIRKQISLFDTQKVDRTIIETYLFFAISLSKDQYSRTELSNITREVNRLFPMPVMILFKHGQYLTLAVINRRQHKRDENKDVLEKITLIKDIKIETPHRAHIEILFDLSFDELQRKYSFTNFVELHNAWQKTLDTKELNKRFYSELSNWYFWAMDHVSFPDDVEKDKAIRNATSLIRLITRIIFIWFIKEKSLVPDVLFDHREMARVLKAFEKNKKSDSYYRAILQNLFFGTLNQQMNERGFARDGSFLENKNNYGVKNLFRYAGDFAIGEKEVLSLFKDIPFLNGGLFDCLDKENDEDKVVYGDGFSRNPKKQAVVPDNLFFGEEIEYNLNAIYGTKNKRYKVKGLFNILSAYKFTVAENTPVEEEIALDPELLGRVFENLLASYNPETQTTARKQTGSFYTPREIVNYMVDESLKAYLQQKLEDETGIKPEDAEAGLDILFSYTEKEHAFSERETKTLITAIDNCKILDPACGSGAFPMGVLHKLVHILHKLDPQNEKWKERQITRARQLDDPAIREKTIEDIESAFANNELDYGRKLYLIENCIYGVDIQPIATQISKLRFFISLVVDQKKQPERRNLGILSLPNLETKFVAANTLIDLDKSQTGGQISFKNPAIEKLEEALKALRHQYFNARTRREKLICQKNDRDLRKKISELLEKDGWNKDAARSVASFDPYDQNSSSPFFDPEWMFGWRDGFDVVIGNPPYARVQTLQQSQPESVVYFKQHYLSAKGSFDIYVIFLEKGFQLVGAKGILSFILPHKFFQAKFGEPIRRYLTKEKSIYQVVRFGAEQVFEEATTYTCLLFLTREPNKNLELYEVTNLENPAEILTAIQAGLTCTGFKKTKIPAPKDSEWIFTADHTTQILQKLRQQSQNLGNITRKIFQGIPTGADKIFVLKQLKQNTETVRCFSFALEREIEIECEIVKPFLMGKDIHRYQRLIPGNIIIYPYSIINSRAKLMPPDQINKRFPLCWRYLQENRGTLSEREQGRFRENWYGFSRPQNLSEFEAVKLLTPEIARGGQMSIDEKGEFYHTTKVYSFVFNTNVKDDLKYFLGILNSKILWFFLSSTGYVLRGGFFTFKTEYLKPFPIPCSLSEKPPTKAQHDLIVHLVDQILAAKQQNPNAFTLPLEAQIDGLVAHLYGLTEEEFLLILSQLSLPDPERVAAANAYRDVERGLTK